MKKTQRYGYQHFEQDVVEQPTLAENSLGISNIYHRMKTNLEPKTFGLNSLSVSTTVTSVTTSVITAATVVTCYAKTMFSNAAPTACRRKRDADSSLLIDDNYDENLNIPLSREK